MKIIVVGGGAAGMMAALLSAIDGHKVILIEKNSKLGKKLFLTGKGRCNLTNACDMEELFNNVVSNPKFMYSAFYAFDNTATVSFFNSLGLKTKVERGNRVFPESDHSSDVIKALERGLHKNGAEILLDTEVVDFITEDIKTDDIDVCEEDVLKSGKKKSKEKVKSKFNCQIVGVRLNNGSTITADKVIVATGGKSYASTGSDGKITDVLSHKGVLVNDLKPALVPFNVRENFVPGMSGLSLKNVSVSLECDGKEIYSGFGEMLFTHFGVSGPLILSASSYLNKKHYGKDALLHIDLKPALSSQMLDERLLRDFSGNMNRHFKNILGGLVPSAMIPSVILLTGISGDKPVNAISKEERHKLIEVIKDYTLTITSDRGFDEAIITSGGVSVKGINPSTMESKIIKGLYFAGEIIDVDALTGGFNLQIAWSSAYLAARSGG